MKKPEEIKKLLSHVEGAEVYCWISGEAIVSFFLGYNVNEVDIHCSSSKDRMLAEGHLFKNGFKVIKRHGLGAKMRKGKIIINILFTKKTPEETVLNLDFSIHCVAFDSEGAFYCHERFFEDLENKNLFFTNNSDSLGGYSFKNRCSRLSSLLKKGFKMEKDSMIFWLAKLVENQKILQSNKTPKNNAFKVLKY